MTPKYFLRVKLFRFLGIFNIVSIDLGLREGIRKQIVIFNELGPLWKSTNKKPFFGGEISPSSQTQIVQFLRPDAVYLGLKLSHLYHPENM